MRFVSRQAEPIPPITYEPPAVDYGDEFLARREVRAPSARDMVNRRPPLPKFFRGPGGPDRAEGERQSPTDIELEGSDFAYTKADSGDGWIDYDDQGRVAHGDPQTVKLDTSGLGA